jgi:hypothetical protein
VKEGTKTVFISSRITWSNKMVFFQKKCVVASPYYYKVIPAMGYVTIELEVTDCPGVAVLEHVSI